MDLILQSGSLSLCWVADWWKTSGRVRPKLRAASMHEPAENVKKFTLSFVWIMTPSSQPNGKQKRCGDSQFEPPTKPHAGGTTQLKTQPCGSLPVSP